MGRRGAAEVEGRDVEESEGFNADDASRFVGVWSCFEGVVGP